MDNNEFDQLIKNKISEERKLVEGSNITEIIDKSIKKAKDEKRSNFRFKKPLIAAVTFLIVSSAAVLIVKESSDIISMKEGNQVADNNSIAIEKSADEVTDITKEKEKLQKDGYIVSKDNIKFEYDSDSYAQKCYASFASIKDCVFSADFVLKGQVLGVSYYSENRQAYTKAKILIEESLDNSFKKGSIITVNKGGGVISHYQQIINYGIDKKFSMSNEELEAEKNQMIVSDNYDGKLLYPDDNVVLLINKNSPIAVSFKEGEYSASGPVVKYKDDKIIRKDSNSNSGEFSSESFDYEKEFYASYNVTDLEKKLKNAIEDRKKSFSKDKAKQAAYKALGESDKKRAISLENSEVIYRTNRGDNGTYGIQINVMLPTDDEYKYMMVSMDNDYKITDILK